LKTGTDTVVTALTPSQCVVCLCYHLARTFHYQECAAPDTFGAGAQCAAGGAASVFVVVVVNLW
jgi:hypothetical protein